MSDLTDFLLARIAEDEAEIALGWDFATLDSSGWMGHAATWGRDRARAECDTKRRIVEAHRVPADEVQDDGTPDCPDCWQTWPCNTLRLLALPFADHPDYREEWRP